MSIENSDGIGQTVIRLNFDREKARRDLKRLKRQKGYEGRGLTVDDAVRLRRQFGLKG